ncbi:MAG: hypothetical protein ACR2LM_01800 [Pyrinomonadaceae bacterium]
MIRKILIVLAISLSFAACNQEAETNKAKPSDTVPAAPSPAVTQAPPASPSPAETTSPVATPSPAKPDAKDKEK